VVVVLEAGALVVFVLLDWEAGFITLVSAAAVVVEVEVVIPNKGNFGGVVVVGVDVLVDDDDVGKVDLVLAPKPPNILSFPLLALKPDVLNDKG